MINWIRRCAALCGVALLVTHGARPTAQDDERRPRLIVLLVVDQFRADYVDNFRHQWTGGLKRLVSEGAWFRDAHYPYFSTVTCAGHASISTGTVPKFHGMILNEWFDRRLGKEVACTDDAAARTISYGRPVATEGESIAHLQVPTLADELRAQLSPTPRVIAFSLKARSAATLGGRHPDAVAWFDDAGTWVTSSMFSAAPLPEVASFVNGNPIEKMFDQVWERSLPKSEYLYEDPAIGVTAPKGSMTLSFPHALKGAAPAIDAGFYTRWQASPLSDEYLARMAIDVWDSMHLTDSPATNLIAISFSALDKVGHEFGPHSHEVQDVLVRLDRTLGAFFSALDQRVGRGNYTVALTADHGVAPLPDRLRQSGIDSGRIDPIHLASTIDAALAKVLGPGKHVEYFVRTEVYLRPGVFTRLRQKRSSLAAVKATIRSVEGIAQVYTRVELEADQFNNDPIGHAAALGYSKDRSGDLKLIWSPYWSDKDKGAEHGTGYEYDNHVPILLMGRGIVQGEYRMPASPTDVAPTLASLAGIKMPKATGRVLDEALVRPPAEQRRLRQ